METRIKTDQYQLRKSSDRGHAHHGWLQAKHSFSFANYYDPENMGFRSLRVINQDIIAPKMGFGTHSHSDMEIITYVLRGGVKHKDSMGNDYVIPAGEIQVMSAGTGVSHSEFNASDNEDLELLQIWIEPDQRGHQPSYDQKSFSRDQKLNQLLLISDSYNSGNESLKIHQDVQLYASYLQASKSIHYKLEKNRFAWLQLISGELNVELKNNIDNELDLKESFQSQSDSVTHGFLKISAGDGLKINQNLDINILSLKDSEFIFFDLN